LTGKVVMAKRTTLCFIKANIEKKEWGLGIQGKKKKAQGAPLGLKPRQGKGCHFGGAQRLRGTLMVGASPPRRKGNFTVFSGLGGGGGGKQKPGAQKIGRQGLRKKHMGLREKKGGVGKKKKAKLNKFQEKLVDGGNNPLEKCTTHMVVDQQHGGQLRAKKEGGGGFIDWQPGAWGHLEMGR